MEATVREYIEAQLALEAMIVLLDLMLADIHDQLWDVDGQAQLVRHSYGEGA